jgi:hypothetical protein
MNVLLPLVAVAAGLAGWAFDPTAFLAAYLVAWWCWLSLCLGALAQVWLHTLTGGGWGEVIRAPMLETGAALWLVALLFLPVLAGQHWLYPWAVPAAGRWQAELAAPDFKRAWLTPMLFSLRAAICLALWPLLAWLSGRAPWRDRRGFAAAALLLYGFSVGLAAMDWIMSLMPLWYSSVFGLLCASAQLLGGMALAIVLPGRPPAPPSVRADLGNLMLSYLLCWAYLEYVQFLIIWSANLPHEIVWYLARADGVWLLVDWALVVLLFAAPLLLLLSRRLKRDEGALRRIAMLVLTMLFVHTCWLVLPSLRLPPWHWLVALPLAVLSVGGPAWAWYRWRMRVEVQHG